MRVSVPFAFATDTYVGTGRRASRRTYHFKRSREVDVPEVSDAPTVLLHAPFKTQGAVGKVAFRRIGDGLFEPVGDPLSSPETAVRDAFRTVPCISAFLADNRFVAERSTLLPDRSSEYHAERQVDAIALEAAFVGGVLHRKTSEPVLVLDRQGVRTSALAVHRDGRTFRLDEVPLLLDEMRHLGLDPATARAALEAFEIVDPSLLAADVVGPAMAVAGHDCLAQIGKRLHARPRAAIEAFVAIRRALHARDVGLESLADAAALAMDALDDGLDDSEVRDKVSGTLRLHRQRTSAYRDSSPGVHI